MDASKQKIASLDPFWDDAYEIAKNAWDHDTSGSPADAARTALTEAGMTPKAVDSVVVMLADNGLCL